MGLFASVVSLVIILGLVGFLMWVVAPDAFEMVTRPILGDPENATAMYVSSPSRKDQCSVDGDCPDGTKCTEGICAPVLIDPTKMVHPK